jgi:hypothetical protein
MTPLIAAMSRYHVIRNSIEENVGINLIDLKLIANLFSLFSFQVSEQSYTYHLRFSIRIWDEIFNHTKHKKEQHQQNKKITDEEIFDFSFHYTGN